MIERRNKWLIFANICNNNAAKQISPEQINRNVNVECIILLLEIKESVTK